MRQLIYTCKRPETRFIGGLKVEYDGELLVITKGHRLDAITADPGEMIIVTVTDGMVACWVK